MIKSTGPPFLLLLLCSCFSSAAQDTSTDRYSDSLWNAVSMEKAFYFTRFVKQDSLYKCTSYYMKSKKLNCLSFTKDTSFTKFIGLLLRYYESGHLQDSTLYSDENSIYDNFHYYENGQLWGHFFIDKINNIEVSEGFEENGKKINNFIFFKDAQFQKGEASWTKYLARSVNAKIPVKNGAPVGSYQVIMKFIIDKEGSIINVEPETHFGFGMEQEVRRVIENSPAWKPLIMFGKITKAYRRQPVTFVVQGK